VEIRCPFKGLTAREKEDGQPHGGGEGRQIVEEYPKQKKRDRIFTLAKTREGGPPVAGTERSPYIRIRSGAVLDKADQKSN